MTLTGTAYSISGQTGTSNGGSSAYCNDTSSITLPNGVTPQVYLNGTQLGTNTTATTSAMTVYQTHSSQCSGAGGTFSQGVDYIECDVDNASSWPCAQTTAYGLDTSPQAQDYAQFDGLSIGITSSSNWYITVQGSTPFKIATGQSLSNGDIIKISWTGSSGSSDVFIPPPPAQVRF